MGVDRVGGRLLRPPWPFGGGKLAAAPVVWAGSPALVRCSSTAACERTPPRAQTAPGSQRHPESAELPEAALLLSAGNRREVALKEMTSQADAASIQKALHEALDEEMRAWYFGEDGVQGSLFVQPSTPSSPSRTSTANACVGHSGKQQQLPSVTSWRNSCAASPYAVDQRSGRRLEQIRTRRRGLYGCPPKLAHSGTVTPASTGLRQQSKDAVAEHEPSSRPPSRGGAGAREPPLTVLYVARGHPATAVDAAVITVAPEQTTEPHGQIAVQPSAEALGEDAHAEPDSEVDVPEAALHEVAAALLGNVGVLPAATPAAQAHPVAANDELGQNRMRPVENEEEDDREITLAPDDYRLREETPIVDGLEETAGESPRDYMGPEDEDDLEDENAFEAESSESENGKADGNEEAEKLQKSQSPLVASKEDEYEEQEEWEEDDDEEEDHDATESDKGSLDADAFEAESEGESKEAYEADAFEEEDEEDNGKDAVEPTDHRRAVEVEDSKEEADDERAFSSGQEYVPFYDDDDDGASYSFG